MNTPPVHVVFVNFSYPAAVADPDQLLARFAGLTGWADGVMAAGGRATVIQRFGRDARLERNGVACHFVADDHGPDLRSWQRSEEVHRCIVAVCREIGADGGAAILHLNGLMYGLQAWLMRRRLPRAVPIVAQHHAERPPTGVRTAYVSRGLRAVDGFFFTARPQADPWLAAGLILPDQPIFEVMEGSTPFRWQERRAARRQTGISGDPVFLWVGRLIDGKDPLTVLRGFEEVLADRPAARLVMVYGSDDLLPQVRERLATSPALTSAVTLLGQLPHAQVEPVCNSADYFVLGSHSEGSGYALAEALACGVVPVVTDIPSFRWMTDDGQIGALWPPGDAGAFAAAARRALSLDLQEQSTAARRQFDRRLSFDAIGRQALDAYRQLIARRAAL